MNYIPMPGYAFIKPEQRFIDTELIEIPERFKQKKKAVAVVEAWSPGLRRRCRCGNVQHIGGQCRQCQRRDAFRIISEHPLSTFDCDIAGKRVLYAETALRRISDDIYAVPIDDILAVIAEDVKLDNAEGDTGIKRCKFCGPCKEGSANGMVMTLREGKHVCPRCLKDETGVKFEYSAGCTN